MWIVYFFLPVSAIAVSAIAYIYEQEICVLVCWLEGFRREPAMVNDINFQILKYQRKSPILATCRECQVKFFTPSEMMKKAGRAESYLLSKFRAHMCVYSPKAKDDEEAGPLREADTRQTDRTGSRIETHRTAAQDPVVETEDKTVVPSRLETSKDRMVRAG
jgi:hypothetical protein